LSEAEQQPSHVTLNTFSPAQTPALISFLNRVLAGAHRRVTVTAADLAARVVDRPGFDPAGLILAWAGNEVIGGVHAIRPAPELATPVHHIAWLAVAPERRRQGVGSRLLRAAENYLYYCPVHFASRSAPFYGIVESLQGPWRGSTEYMGLSALHDRELAEWLGKRGFSATDPGDVSLRGGLHDRERPRDPGLSAAGLALIDISERSPWAGDTPEHGFRKWGRNGGQPYQGLILAERDRAAGFAVWYPLPDDETAALAGFEVEPLSNKPGCDAFLLDLALHRMARQGYLWVETCANSISNPATYALLRSRDLEVADYWVNLVKT
jgi:GNAT superfamily N-acetyltransferase